MSHPKDLQALFSRLEARLFPSKSALYLTPALSAQFLVWSEDERHNTPKWIATQRRLLAWWRAELDKVDLRTASLAGHILPALDSEKGSRTHRIAVLKRLYSWLRVIRHDLSPAEDPTCGALSVPQSTPAQWRTPRVVSKDEYRKTRKELNPHWRAALDVLAGTGWHLTELLRFVRDGQTRRTRRGPVLTCPRRKSGAPLRTRVSNRVLKAADYLRERGTLSEKRFRLALKEASDRLTPGCMRHSVATHAIDEKDETPAAVSGFLGHASERTLKRFYATHAVPAKIATLADR